MKHIFKMNADIKLRYSLFSVVTLSVSLTWSRSSRYVRQLNSVPFSFSGDVFPEAESGLHSVADRAEILHTLLTQV
jgi:hypothetical protein